MRPRNLRVAIDFSHSWAMLNHTPLNEQQKQSVFYHIFSVLELDLQRVINQCISHCGENPGNEWDDIMQHIPFELMAALCTEIYQLMVYHNLFVVEVPDDGNGLISEFPWGCMHCDRNVLVLVAEQMAGERMIPGAHNVLGQLQETQNPQFQGSGPARIFS